MFFDLQTHTAHGVAFANVINCIERALQGVKAFFRQ
jgi:hypothetical protein